MNNEFERQILKNLSLSVP